MGYLGAGHLLIFGSVIWAFFSGSKVVKALLADSDCLSPRPEAANEFYDGDHDNDKESDVEI